MKIIPSILLALVLTGCVTRPLRPGQATFNSPTGFSGNVKQSENPQSESSQDYERKTETEVPLQPGDVITGRDDKGNEQKITVSSPRTARVTQTEKSTAKIGAAQKDTGREIAAKLSSLKGVVWVGILLFVFGAASLVYPPLKLVVASQTTSVVCIIAGIALIALPSLIVGHEVLILAVGGGAAFIWWFAHRHGHIHGELKTLKGKQ